jgi:hypothetical protein
LDKSKQNLRHRFGISKRERSISLESRILDFRGLRATGDIYLSSPTIGRRDQIPVKSHRGIDIQSSWDGVLAHSYDITPWNIATEMNVLVPPLKYRKGQEKSTVSEKYKEDRLKLPWITIY